jgi:molybdopterin converting factor small subunit
MLKGNKNDACIYLKGSQGIGKSTISDFLKENVIGTNLFLETGSSPLKNKFNSILQGKLLVQFSELENFNSNEWASVSSVLKRFITSSTYMLEGKNENPIQINNINNYILDSNNDAIKDSDGRRYFIADVSPKYQNNRQYFGKIRNECFNTEVGNAFYSLMLERNTNGFIPQNYPETENKKLALTKRLDSSYLFLKDEYILKKQEMKIKPKDLFDDYSNYCRNNKITRTHAKNDFISKLSEIGINYKKTGGNHYYKYTYEELQAIADKQRWIHELDEYETDAKEQNPIQYTESYVNSLEKKIRELEARLKERENIYMEDEDEDEISELNGKCYIEIDIDEEESEDVEPDEYEENEEEEEQEDEDILGLYF